MKNIILSIAAMISISLPTDHAQKNYQLEIKVPAAFEKGIATLILAESNRDTLRAPIINGYAKFTGTRTLDTTWAFVTFKQEDLYGEMPCLVFGNQITLTAEPIETYKYVPAEKAHQEQDHILALHTVLAVSKNKKSDWERQATMYQREERIKDSLLGLISQQKKS